MIKKLQHYLILLILNGGVLGYKSVTTPGRVWLYGGRCDKAIKNLSCLVVIVVFTSVSFVF
jgi:hypothetical protein